MRRQLAKGVRMYTGDDFNYAELIAGDERATATRCSASSMPSRRPPPPRSARWPPATASASTTSWRRRCRCRATSSRRRPASTRPASSSWPTSTACRTISSWSAASRARARFPPGGAVPPRRPRRPAARSGHGPPPHGARAGRARDRLMRSLAVPPVIPEAEAFAEAIRDLRAPARAAGPGSARSRTCAAAAAGMTGGMLDRRHDARPGGRPPAPLDQHGDAAQAARPARHHRGVRAARHPRHRSLARPGARRGPRSGRQAGEGRRPPALGLLPRRLLHGRRCRGPARRAGGQPQGRRRGQDARRAMPGAGGGLTAGRTCRQTGLQGHRPGPRPGARRHRRDPGVRTGVGMPLAIEPLHPMQAAERACINTLEHALDICDALDPGRTGAFGVALDIYHVWWDPKLDGQIARAAASASSPTTCATGWCRRATSSTTAA